MAKTPLGAKIVSAAVMLLSIPFLLTALLIFLTSGVVSQAVENLLGGLFAGALIITAFILFVLGVAYASVGVALWRGREWARVTIVVLSSIWLFFSLVGILVGVWPSLLSFVLNVFLTVYFMRKSVRKNYR